MFGSRLNDWSSRSSGYVSDEFRFDTTPLTNRKKGMKQIMPMAKTTATSTRANGTPIKNGCISKKTINATNNTQV